MPLGKGIRATAGADEFWVARYFYDASNAAAQDGYWLTNVRLGLGGETWRITGAGGSSASPRA